VHNLAINHGKVIDPKNRTASILHLLIDNGKIAEVSRDPFTAGTVIDARDKIVCPGFVDIHMHEDSVTDPKKGKSHTFEALLKMGVTTAIGGNCGGGPEDFIKYIEEVESKGALLNLGLLIPHGCLRSSVGKYDRYGTIEKETVDQMHRQVTDFMARGALGISYGIRYIPGINEYELMETAKPVIAQQGLIAAHIRDDAKGVFKAAKEFLKIADLHASANLQISHIGSMAAYGQMEPFLSLMDQYRERGYNVSADCYPYNAFSTGIGTTTYDPGFLKRYEISYRKVVITDGPYRGQSLTKERYEELRKNAPKTMTVAHVMKEAEVSLALSHPGVMIASDGFINNDQGHPRAAGTFPRFLRKVLDGEISISLSEAIDKMTAMPAAKAGISKGSLEVGSDADIVIFDPEKVRDKATFEEPTEIPEGIEYVLVNGDIAVKQGAIQTTNAGQMIKKER
jgi:N-acyl-D-amino-acid deacylase